MTSLVKNSQLRPNANIWLAKNSGFGWERHAARTLSSSKSEDIRAGVSSYSSADGIELDHIARKFVRLTRKKLGAAALSLRVEINVFEILNYSRKICSSFESLLHCQYIYIYIIDSFPSRQQERERERDLNDRRIFFSFFLDRIITPVRSYFQRCSGEWKGDHHYV